MIEGRVVIRLNRGSDLNTAVKWGDGPLDPSTVATIVYASPVLVGKLAVVTVNLTTADFRLEMEWDESLASAGDLIFAIRLADDAPLSDRTTDTIWIDIVGSAG